MPQLFFNRIIYYNKDIDREVFEMTNNNQNDKTKKTNLEDKKLTNKELSLISGGIKGTPGGNGSTKPDTVKK